MALAVWCTPNSRTYKLSEGQGEMNLKTIKQTSTEAEIRMRVQVYGRYPKANHEYLDALAKAIEETVTKFRRGKTLLLQDPEVYVEHEERGEFI